MKVKIINKSSYALPSYATEASAGMDLRANLTESISIQPPYGFIHGIAYGV